VIKLLHVGLDGCSNIGDQAITDCLKIIFKRSDRLRYDFYRLNYGVSSPVNGEAIVKKKPVINFLRKIRLLKLIYEIVLPGFKWKYYKGFYDSAKQNDRVVIGGGNIVMDIDILFPFHLLILSILSRLAGAKCGLVVAGVGPIKTKLGLLLCSAFIRNLDFVTVRDEKSMAVIQGIAKQVPVTILPDPVFYINELLATTVKKPGCGVALISVFPFGDSRVAHNSDSNRYKLYLKLISDYHDKLTRLGYGEISLLVTDQVRDLGVARDLIGMRKYTSIITPASTEELLNCISNTNFLLATRMHPAIIAASFEIPFLALAWQDKVLECLSLVGLRDSVSDIRRLDDFTNTECLKPYLTSEASEKLAVKDYEHRLINSVL